MAKTTHIELTTKVENQTWYMEKVTNMMPKPMMHRTIRCYLTVTCLELFPRTRSSLLCSGRSSLCAAIWVHTPLVQST